MKKTALISSLIFAAPLVAFAQTAGLNNVYNIITGFASIVNLLIPLFIALALVFFFWGLIKYIRTSGEGHTEGRNTMIAGLVALFVMVSVWGIIRFAQDTLNIQGNNGAVQQVAPRVY